MTRQDFERKTNDGTLTVRELVDNVQLLRGELDNTTTTTLRRVAELLASIADTSTDKACNTDCVAYANGSCRYLNGDNLNEPVEVYGYEDIRKCPRYRAAYPERV